jgi:hypothetical protein
MASETTSGSNIEIVREYTERVFNQHSPDLTAKYLAPGVGRRRRDGDLVSSRGVHAAVARDFKASRRGRSRVIRIAVVGKGRAGAGLAATGAAPTSFADFASKTAPAWK